MLWELILVFVSAVSISELLWTVKIHSLPSKTTLLFFQVVTVIARLIFFFFFDTPHCSILKIPAALHYPVSPFVSKVVKGVSISFLLLSKTLSRVSSSLFTLIMRYWQRCRFKAFFGLDWSLSALKLITLSIWQTVLSFLQPVSNGNMWRKNSFIHIICSLFYPSAIKTTLNLKFSHVHRKPPLFSSKFQHCIMSTDLFVAPPR